MRHAGDLAGRGGTRATAIRAGGSLWRGAVLVLVAFWLVVGLGDVPAQAAFPGANGPLVFSRPKPPGLLRGGYDIFTVNEDGLGLSDLTLVDPAPVDNGQAGEVYNYGGAFSPDGTKIAFYSAFDATVGVSQPFRVYTMNADGSDLTRLTNDNEPDAQYDPSFSPDGRRIVFTNHTDFHNVNTISVMNSDGSGKTSLGVQGLKPVFSPDGTKIAFFRVPFSGGAFLFLMNADGSGAHKISSIPYDSARDPAFSPDGRRIAFSVVGQGGTGGSSTIYMVNVDGSGLTRVPTPPNLLADDQYLLPAFSPDGREIAFMSNRATSNPSSFQKWWLYVMNLDGSNLRQLAPVDYPVSAPDWGVRPGTAPAPADVRLSEFRLRGGGGPSDEFVELTNRNSVRESIGGLRVEACDAQGAVSGVDTVASGTELDPGQSYLLGGAGYAGASDQRLRVDLPDSGLAGVRIVSAAGAVLDSAGAPSSPCAEGAGLPLPQGDGDYSFVRKTAANQFVDTADNAADFDFVSPTAGAFSGVQSKLGVIGSEPLADPRRLSFGFRPGLFDATQTSSGSNNRSFSSTGFGGDSGSQGVLRVRRSFTNTSSQPVNDLRLRVHRLTTKENRTAGQADLRLIDSAAETRTVSGGSRTALATTFEQKDQCPTGTGEPSRCGGLNARATVALPAPVNPGETVSFNLDFAVEQTGAFSLFLVPEALP